MALKRRKPLRKVSKKQSGSYFKKCDRLRRQIVILRAKGRCEICGRFGRLEDHHLIHRECMFFRHNLENGIALCFECHKHSGILSAHGAPWAFEKWMLFHRRKQYDWWEKNRYDVHIGAKINYKEVCGNLENALDLLAKEA